MRYLPNIEGVNSRFEALEVDLRELKLTHHLPKFETMQSFVVEGLTLLDQTHPDEGTRSDLLSGASIFSSALQLLHAQSTTNWSDRIDQKVLDRFANDLYTAIVSGDALVVANPRHLGGFALQAGKNRFFASLGRLRQLPRIAQGVNNEPQIAAGPEVHPQVLSPKREAGYLRGVSQADKRYQVFISSTYEDLKQERRAVIEHVLSLGWFPAAMEWFTGVNEDKWTVIKRFLEQSDYMVVILGGRYGSGWCEREFAHASENGIPIIVLIHDDLGKLPSNCVDTGEQARMREAFKEKLETKMVRRWSSEAGLVSAVAAGLQNLSNSYPRDGWIRGPQAGL